MQGAIHDGELWTGLCGHNQFWSSVDQFTRDMLQLGYLDCECDVRGTQGGDTNECTDAVSKSVNFCMQRQIFTMPGRSGLVHVGTTGFVRGSKGLEQE